MNYRDIIKESWDITTTYNQKLFYLGFVPSVLTLLMGIAYVIYQTIAFSHSSLFSHSKVQFNYISAVKPVLAFVEDHPGLSVSILIAGILLFIAYTIIPLICGAALIDLIHKLKQGKPVMGGIIRGLKTLFPLLEITTLLSPFGLISYLTELFMVVRNFGSGSFIIVIPVLTFVFVIGLFFKLLFVFCEQYIVLDGYDMIKAMKRSSFVVICNIKDTFFLSILLLLIGLRVLITLVLILSIPFLLFSFFSLASFLPTVIGITLSAIVGGALFFGGVYLMANFNIFAYALWTLSFMYIKEKQDLLEKS